MNQNQISQIINWKSIADRFEIRSSEEGFFMKKLLCSIIISICLIGCSSKGKDLTFAYKEVDKVDGSKWVGVYRNGKMKRLVPERIGIDERLSDPKFWDETGSKISYVMNHKFFITDLEGRVEEIKFMDGEVIYDYVVINKNQILAHVSLNRDEGIMHYDLKKKRKKLLGQWNDVKYFIQNITISPKKDFILINLTDYTQSPRRQPYLLRYDVKTREITKHPLSNVVRDVDIFSDGRKAICSAYWSKKDKSGPRAHSLGMLDLKTYEIKRLSKRYHFIQGLRLMPDEKHIIFSSGNGRHGVQNIETLEFSKFTEYLGFTVEDPFLAQVNFKR